MKLLGRSAALLLSAAILLLIAGLAVADGYWMLDGVSRGDGGRDDVSTTWENASDTAVMGRSTWKWPSMDQPAITVSGFSWNDIPPLMEPGQRYNLTVYLEQIENNWAGSSIVIYPGWPNNIHDLNYLNMSGVGYGPRVDFGTGDGLVGNNTLTIYAPYHQPADPPYYALLINCWLYHDWYAVQYRYKWMEGDAPSNYEPPKILIDSLDQGFMSASHWGDPI